MPGLQGGGNVIDIGANKGRFSSEVAAKYPVKVISVEANPNLAHGLRLNGLTVVECAAGAADGVVEFHIGTNDEASSFRLPSGSNAHLVVEKTLRIPMKTLGTILKEAGISRSSCVKIDIEGGEIDVLKSVTGIARKISPQWTVEFHDDQEFQLCKSSEVDAAIATFKFDGFSVLVRNWPSRTNVLFLDRSALGISWLEWMLLVLRYQYVAVFWRIITRTKARFMAYF